MSGLKDLAKGGWHPKGKDGGKESWRGDFKGINTVAGWVGKGKTNEHERAEQHTSTPLNQLKDPDSFGPPPKRTTFSAAAGGATPSSVAPSTRLTTSTGGLGSSLSQRQLEEDRRLAQERIQAQQEAEEEPKLPTGPYRADTTGLSTTNLPPPPKFRGAGSNSPDTGTVARPLPPSLPPRLPPRQTPAVATASSPQSTYTPSADSGNGILNQGALNRLGTSGVRVPGLGIGASQSSSPAPPPPPSRSHAGPSTSQLSELQSRFSRLNSGTSSPSAASPPASETSGEGAGGTTWAQKQAALRTASDFRKDPSSVSLSDARSAVGTANNFHERHGEQVAAGWKTASGLNQKYGISDKFGAANSATSTHAAPAGVVASSSGQDTGVLGGIGKKKPPPPPPAKRLGLGGVAPPVPLGSKPGAS